MEKTKTKKIIGVPEGMKWEIKDRLYELKGNKKPLVLSIPSKHSAKRPLLYFDEKLGYNREIKYATNQPSPLADEQKGETTLGRIIMRSGKLFVPKEQQSLQKLLSIYHPLKGDLYEEYDKIEEATDDLAYMEFEIEALLVAKGLDVDEAEGILRSEIGSNVNNMTSKEIKRDVLLMARRNPGMFLQLANDENVELKNIGAKFVENNLISLSPDQRYFKYPNGKKLCTVPYDEHPMNALAAFFKTDEGMELFKNLSKKLK
tara:strand:+ start:152 stop:931 length:780 start_codon:yes stop_codon:yes gene_type:complete